MGRKNSPSANKELNELIAQYETARAENRQLYLDGDQLADIADQYAAERKFNEAQEVITYGLHLHPDSTDLTGRTSFIFIWIPAKFLWQKKWWKVLQTNMTQM